MFVSATFVSTKPGTAPPINIESPVDLNHHIGAITSKDFQLLKEKIKSLVEDQKSGLYFHQDAKNKYVFDESGLPHGGIYGLRNRRKDDEDKSKKVTASKLVPIETGVEFEKHLRAVSEINYMRRGRRNTIKKIRNFSVELCIVLVREKVKKTPPPTSSIIVSGGSGYTQTTSLSST